MKTLLFVDDDTALLEANRIHFTNRNYQVLTAPDGTLACSLLRKHPVDCIILDVMLPGKDGYILCREFRRESSAPIIFLTSLSDQNHLYRGFMEGGDDYMTKPYAFRELELRIEARINQSKGFLSRKEILDFSPLMIDISARQALIRQAVIPLTANEFDILVLLARTPGTVFSLNAIYREIWQMPDLETAQTVRVHIGRMRQKLEAACPERQYIKTVWGKGYLFSET